MSTAEHHTTTPASAGASKKHTRSRGRSKKAPDPYASSYGVIPFELFGGGPWMPVRDLGEATVGKHVLLFGKVWSVQPVSRTMTVVVLFHHLAASTVRCVVVAGSQEGVTTRTVRFAATLTREAVIDVEGVVSLPEGGRVLGTTQQVEVQVRKIHSIGVNHANKPRGGKLQRSRASVTRGPVKLEEESVVEVEPEGEIVTRGPVKLEESVVEVEPEGEIVTRGPVKLEEESVVEVEPEGEIVRAGQAGRVLAHIDPEKSLNYGCINLPSLVDHAILRIQSEVEFKIMECFRTKGFVGIHTQSMVYLLIAYRLCKAKPESKFCKYSADYSLNE